MRKKDLIWIFAIIIIALLIYSRLVENRDPIPTQLLEDENTSIRQEDSSNIREKEDILNFTRQNAITNSIKKVQPAVVSVNVIKTKIVRRRMSFFFNFYDEIPYNVKAIGSGVIFSNDGYIITNQHVVEGATEIKIILTDNRQFEGKIVGSDKIHDIAILKIDGKDLPFAKLGTSSDLIIGEWSIALGNPYGYLMKDSKPSVSVGVVSAVNRDFAENQNGKIYRRMIQTDAAINQGNSGGPLVNIRGEVIGINTFIFSESGGSIGIGFAIPIDRVKKQTKEIVEYGEIRKIWFGFKVQDINPMLASYFNLDNMNGVLVNNLEKGSPAQKAGLQKLDIITKINSSKIKDTTDAEMAITDITIGDRIILEIIRDGRRRSIEIIASEYKRESK